MKSDRLLKPLVIAQITDTHILAPGDGDPAGVGRSDNLRRCVDDINGLDPGPDAVVHTGDMTHHGREEEFDQCRHILSALHAPLFVIPGNRDGRDGVARAFAAEPWFPRDAEFIQYAVDRFAVRLIGVDSLSSNSNKGDFCAVRMSALDAMLGEVLDRPTVLFLHHPPFDVTGARDPFQYQRRGAVSALAAVLARHPQVLRIFCGHAHRPRTTSISGVAASTAASIAVDLRMGSYPPAMAARPVYQVHRFNGQGAFSSETRWPVA